MPRSAVKPTLVQRRQHDEDRDPHASSSTTIIRSLIEGLYSGKYVPGQRLVEKDLTTELGVSRGSVREALSRLAAEGIVSHNFYRGSQIRLLTRKEALDTLVPVELLVGLTARLAAEHIDIGKNRASLQAAIDNLMAYESRPDFLGLIRARNSFYRTLSRIGDNQELSRILPTVHVHLLRVQFRAYVSDAETERFDDYRQMAEAVLNGNGRQAEVAARRHVRRLASAIATLPDTAFART
jgi:DNA-binding GntR family transcriptional regulator